MAEAPPPPTTRGPTSPTDVHRLSERLYVEAMRSGERERRGWPTDAWFWDERARRVLEAGGAAEQERTRAPDSGEQP